MRLRTRPPLLTYLLILHFVDPISGTVGGHTKNVHATIRLDGRNLVRQVWSVIDERKSSCEARRPLQVMEVSIEIQHDMRYRQGAAEFRVFHFLYLSTPKRQIIRNLRRGKSYCARPRAKTGRNDEIIPFCSSYLATQCKGTSERGSEGASE